MDLLSIVAVRYPELVLYKSNQIYIGHFVPHETTVAQEGFRTVLWNASKDLRLAVEDIVAFCNYLKNLSHFFSFLWRGRKGTRRTYRNLQQGATS